MSAFQELKWFIVHTIQMDKDGIHIYIGVACYLIALWLGRLPAASYRALVPGLALSLVMEFIDVFDAFRFDYDAAWAGGVWDIVNSNLIPVIIVLCARRGLFGREARGAAGLIGRDERI